MHVWRIQAKRVPSIVRHCPSCRCDRPYCSTESFRVNSQKRRVDAWLIYRCKICGARWNRDVFSRKSLRTIDPQTLQRLMSNDRALAREIACDLTGIDGRFIHLETEAVNVESQGTREVFIEALKSSKPVTLELRFIDNVPIRLDKLLASELGATRSHLTFLHKRGDIIVAPGKKKAFRRSAKEEQRITFTAAGVSSVMESSQEGGDGGGVV